MDLVSSTNKIDHHDDSSNEPTPGGPLTMERIKEMGIIKMNDYLSTGTRQQFWEEYYVKVVMQVSIKSLIRIGHLKWSIEFVTNLSSAI